jgi:hypothetical protein
MVGEGPAGHFPVEVGILFGEEVVPGSLEETGQASDFLVEGEGRAVRQVEEDVDALPLPGAVVDPFEDDRRAKGATISRVEEGEEIGMMGMRQVAGEIGDGVRGRCSETRGECRREDGGIPRREDRGSSWREDRPAERRRGG